jgi:hypothetical protein
MDENRIVSLLLAMIFCFACSQVSKEEPAVVKKDTVKLNNAVNTVRENVRKEPVASYSEKTENPLNDWYFKVQLFETENTFHYLMKLQYEEIRGLDTLKLPNFGRMPEPVIKKGDQQYSCIIGFLDKENKFREYKKVYVKDNVLKVTTIKHYSVRSVNY